MAIISNKVASGLQFRIQQEEFSSRLYKSMSNWLNIQGFTGAAKLWEKYSQEELKHAEWAYNRLLDLNILPVVSELSAPQHNFTGLPQIIALTYKHEFEVTEQCEQFAKLCLAESDFKNLDLAQLYCKEQVEELNKIQTWLDKLDAFGDSKEALRLLDDDMSK